MWNAANIQEKGMLAAAKMVVAATNKHCCGSLL
jgi:hypothetical protein